MQGGASEPAAIAHVLRRTTFGPMPGAIERALDTHGTATALLEAQIAADPVPFIPPPAIDAPFDPADTTLVNEQLVEQWLVRMSSDQAGLHEKMMWFWHSHFTTAFSKAVAIYCWRQLRTIHQHALGNFGDLARAIVQDAAMLQYLDGDDTQADNPNENLARELLELYTTGRGHYTEDDIRAASRALAGWVVSSEWNGAQRIDWWTLKEPVTFLGETKVHDPVSVVDRILQSDAVAPFIVGKLARYLVGPQVPEATLAAWATLFRDGGWEIAPVVAAMLRSPEFAAARYGRARHGIEWHCTLRRVLDEPDMEMWELMPIAQIPYAPRSVAGWPDTWLTVSSLYARIAFLERIEVRDDILPAGPDLAAEALARCGLVEISDESRRGIEQMVDDGASPADVLRGALALPEFALA